MYSLIMMAAMSSAPDTASFGGSWYNSCTLDSCCPTRYGWKSYGCVQYTPIHCGCGGYNYGCYGGCYGCYGGGCYGGGYGAGCYGYGRGYWTFDGPSWGAGYAGFGATGNYGNYGTYPVYPPVYSSPVIGLPMQVTPGIGTGAGAGPGTGSGSGISPTPNNQFPPPFEPLVPRKETRDFSPKTGSLTTATIVVEVPANAKVFIDGYEMKSTAPRRVFTTPSIEKNQDYYYTVKVVVEENGHKVEDSQKIVVRGGEQTATSFAYLKNDRPAIAEAPRK